VTPATAPLVVEPPSRSAGRLDLAACKEPPGLLTSGMSHDSAQPANRIAVFVWPLVIELVALTILWLLLGPSTDPVVWTRSIVVVSTLLGCWLFARHRTSRSMLLLTAYVPAMLLAQVLILALCLALLWRSGA
jgi:hypothetical protein